MRHVFCLAPTFCSAVTTVNCFVGLLGLLKKGILKLSHELHSESHDRSLPNLVRSGFVHESVSHLASVGISWISIYQLRLKGHLGMRVYETPRTPKLMHMPYNPALNIIIAVVASALASAQIACWGHLMPLHRPKVKRSLVLLQVRIADRVARTAGQRMVFRNHHC